MPKDEFDFEDPFELNGLAFLTHEDTTSAMAECFVEEFLRMGYNAKQVLALFRNPHYVGPNLALEKCGEPFVRDMIVDVFARWGKPVAWPHSGTSRGDEPHAINPKVQNPLSKIEQHLVTSAAATDEDELLTDPMGAPIPKLNL